MTSLSHLIKKIIIVGSLGISAATFVNAATTVKMGAEEFLSRLHHTNEAEMKLGRMAHDKSTTKEVKKYGSQLEDDHRAAEKKVVALAKSEKITLRDPVAATPEEKAKMENHEMTVKKLETLTGTAFDEAFLSAMADGHREVLSLLKNTDTGDAKVKALQARLTPVIEQHLEHAQMLEAKKKQ